MGFDFMFTVVVKVSPYVHSTWEYFVTNKANEICSSRQIILKYVDLNYLSICFLCYVHIILSNHMASGITSLKESLLVFITDDMVTSIKPEYI